jgi:predicted NBD/HSP70 family sugar kinase
VSTTPVRRALRPSGRLQSEDQRRHHRALLLQLLFRSGPASRADLARTTGMSRPAVSDVVGELLAEGLLSEEAAPTTGRVGKPPVTLRLNDSAHAIIAVDLSQSGSIKAAVVDLAGRVGASVSHELGDRRGAEALADVHDLVRECLASAGTPVLGIGIGSPGVVDENGVVLDAPNLGWTDVPLAAGLSEELGVPVFVANDANAAVLGEHTFGRAGEGGLMLLRVGTGVGAGLVLEGALLHGHRGAAGEIGHVVVDPDGAQCACGRRGCLETVLAVPALEQASDLASVGEQLGAALAPVVATLNLHELVLSGPGAYLDGPLLDATARTIRERTMPVTGEELVVRTSALGQDVVLVGAAVLVMAGRLGVS